MTTCILTSHIFFSFGLLLFRTQVSCEKSALLSRHAHNSSSTQPHKLTSSKKPVASDVTTFGCPALCQCYKNDRVTCVGPRKFIPRVPLNTHYFRSIDANLSTLSRPILSNLSHVELHFLILRTSNIRFVTGDAFQDLRSLKTLSLNGNPVSASSLAASFFSIVSEGFRDLNLYNTSMTSLSDDLFEGLGNRSMRLLRLSRNSLSTFSTSPFATFARVKLLDLTNNRINRFNFTTSAKIRELLLKKNTVTKIPDFCLWGDAESQFVRRRSAFQELAELDLSHNSFETVPKFSGDCLPNLEKLFIMYCPLLRDIENNFISDLSRLQVLELRGLQSPFAFEPFAFNSSSLERLTLAENMDIDHEAVNVIHAFRYLPHLKSLTVSNTKIALDPESTAQLLQPLTSLDTLQLITVGIDFIPNNLLWRMTRLKKLVLQSNKLTASALHAALFNVSSIEMLNVQDNSLTTVTQSTFPSLFLQNVKEIDLRNSRFACTCELLWFRKWLDDKKRQEKINITRYPSDQYRCGSPLHMRRVRLSDFNPTEEDCNNNMRRAYIVIALVGSCVVIVAVVVSTLGYRYRWDIRFLLYRLRRRKRYVQENNSEAFECFKYDVYLAHSADDLDWINEELLPLLEEEHGLAVFVEERDTVGGTVAENIPRYMDESSRVLLLISDHYNNDRGWRQYEFKHVIHASIEQQKDVIVVLLGNVEAGRMTQNMRRLLTKGTFLQWGDSEEAKRAFREGLDLTLRTQDTAFHRRLNDAVQVRHPTLWMFIRLLKDNQTLTEDKMSKADRGHAAPRRRRKWKQLEERLTQLKQEFHDGDRDLDAYWRGVAYDPYYFMYMSSYRVIFRENPGNVF